MAWWKIGVIGTVVWLLGVIVIGGAVVVSVMKDEPHNARDAQLRSEKAGRAVGGISAPILMGIWFYAWRRRPTTKPIEIARGQRSASRRKS